MLCKAEEEVTQSAPEGEELQAEPEEPAEPAAPAAPEIEGQQETKERETQD